MRKLALAAAAPRMQLAQADVKVKIKSGDHGVRRKVVIRDRRHFDRGRHHGWRHGQHHGSRKVVIIKKHGHGKTVIKKRITHRHD
jgi:hypothetical protein